MFTWYAAAVGIALVSFIGAVAAGATFSDLLVGFSTGIIATTSMIYFVQSIIDERDQTNRAPAMIVALSICIRIYQDFKYTWIDLALTKNLVGDGTDWKSKEFFEGIQREVDLQDKTASLYSLEAVTLERYLDVVRAAIRRNIQEVLTVYVSYADPEIIALLHVLQSDQGSFCGQFFENTYRRKRRFGAADWSSDALYRRVQRDIYVFERLLERANEVYSTIQYSRKEALWKRLMYGVTNQSGEW